MRRAVTKTRQDRRLCKPGSGLRSGAMAAWSSAPPPSPRQRGRQAELDHFFSSANGDDDDHHLLTAMRAPLLGIKNIEVEGSTRQGLSSHRPQTSSSAS